MFNVIHRGAVSTTMDAAREPDVHLGVFDSLLAESQTNGRGQYRRNWGSPAGNLYASLRLPMEPPFVGTEAAVACGAAVCAALEGYGYPAVMKWPNDVALMFGGTPRKVCGILTEAAPDAAGGLAWVIPGIGINVTPPPGGYPPEIASTAGAVFPDAAPEDAAAKLAVDTLDALIGLYKAMPEQRFHAEYLSRLTLLGREVSLPDGVHGTVTGIDTDFRLLVSSGGKQLALDSGEIT